MCYECNGLGHLKKECPNYLRGKGKAYATTLSDSDSSNSDSEESCDGEGNYSAFMTITHNEFLEELNLLLQELGDYSDQENNNSLLEKSGKYTRIAKAAVKKMKKAEEDYKSLLARYKEAKCEIETMNGELTEAYSKIIFLELEVEVVQANAKIERVSTKKLNDVISSQKHFSNKSGLGYTGGSSSSANVNKEMKFVKRAGCSCLYS